MFVRETTQFYHKFVNFTRMWGRLWRVSDCEELVWGYSQEVMGLPLPRVLVFEVVIA